MRGRLKPGRQLHERARQSGKIQGFDQTLRRTDLSRRSSPEESAHLVIHRRAAVLRHPLEASERVELGLSVEHTFYGLGSQRPDQFALEIGYAREKAEGFERPAPAPAPGGGDRNVRPLHEGECAADVPLIGDVIDAAKGCALSILQPARGGGEARGQ